MAAMMMTMTMVANPQDWSGKVIDEKGEPMPVVNPARRTFTLDLTWKFNEARSKYRGSGAGEKQKARM